MLTNQASLVIGATATMIFTSLWDALAQARVMRYEPVLGAEGVALSERMMESIKDRTKQWDNNCAAIILTAVSQEAELAAAEAGMSPQDPRFEDLRKQIAFKYENEEQISILRSVFISQEAIKILRKVLRPIIVRRTGESIDNSGKPILGLPLAQTFTAWSPMARHERQTQQEINQEHRNRKLAGAQGRKQDMAMIKWHNFLMSQKDASVHVLIYQLKKIEQEKRHGKSSAKAKTDSRKAAQSLAKSITADWNESNIHQHASTRMLTVDKIVEHFWDGNPPPIVFKEDGTRDLKAAVRDPWPCDKPRKFLVYVAYHAHRDLMAEMFRIKKRGHVCYDGSMATTKRQSAVEKFNNDPTCRIMVISNVGSTGLNLVAASVVIVVSNVWSGLEQKQLFGRVDRPGQMRDVLLYNIVAPEGIDLALMCYSESKTTQSEQFMMSRKNLRQLYVDVTAPEDDSDHNAEEVHASSNTAKATKVVARKRKDRDEEGLDDTMALELGAPIKRAKPSVTKDTPVKKARPPPGSAINMASASRLRNSALPKLDQGGSSSAQPPKPQEDRLMAALVPGGDGQVQTSHLDVQAPSLPDATPSRALVKLPSTAPAASCTSESDGKGTNSQLQSTTGEESLSISESSTRRVEASTSARPLGSFQTAPKKLRGFAKPPPSKVAIPGCVAQPSQPPSAPLSQGQSIEESQRQKLPHVEPPALAPHALATTFKFRGFAKPPVKRAAIPGSVTHSLPQQGPKANSFSEERASPIAPVQHVQESPRKPPPRFVPAIPTIGSSDTSPPTQPLSMEVDNLPSDWDESSQCPNIQVAEPPIETAEHCCLPTQGLPLTRPYEVNAPSTPTTPLLTPSPLHLKATDDQANFHSPDQVQTVELSQTNQAKLEFQAQMAKLIAQPKETPEELKERLMLRCGIVDRALWLCENWPIVIPRPRKQRRRTESGGKEGDEASPGAVQHILDCPAETEEPHTACHAPHGFGTVGLPLTRKEKVAAFHAQMARLIAQPQETPQSLDPRLLRRSTIKVTHGDYEWHPTINRPSLIGKQTKQKQAAESSSNSGSGDASPAGQHLLPEKANAAPSKIGQLALQTPANKQPTSLSTVPHPRTTIHVASPKSQSVLPNDMPVPVTKARIDSDHGSKPQVLEAPLQDAVRLGQPGLRRQPSSIQSVTKQQHVPFDVSRQKASAHGAAQSAPVAQSMDHSALAHNSCKAGQSAHLSRSDKHPGMINRSTNEESEQALIARRRIKQLISEKRSTIAPASPFHKRMRVDLKASQVPTGQGSTGEAHPHSGAQGGEGSWLSGSQRPPQNKVVRLPGTVSSHGRKMNPRL